MPYSDNTMWQAVMDSNREYDGHFFYGVKTVGVYCRPSCKSRTPLRKNVRYFLSGREAEAFGFRPCKRCRPEKDIYSPKQELANQGKAVADLCFKSPEKLSAAIKNLGTSPGYLSTVFREQMGMTFSDYVRQRRLMYAKNQLRDQSLPIADIAEELEFSSLAAFYAFFKKYAHITPKLYRNSVFKTDH